MSVLEMQSEDDKTFHTIQENYRKRNKYLLKMCFLSFLSFVGNKSTYVTFQNRLEVVCIKREEAWGSVAVWLDQTNNMFH